MERQQLLSDLRSIPQQDSSTDDLEALAAGLAECARAAVEACQAGLQRCQRLTGGLELGSFASVADDCLSQHINLLQVSFGPGPLGAIRLGSCLLGYPKGASQHH